MRKLYTEALIGRGDITIEEAEQALRDYQQQLEKVFTEVREADEQPTESDDRAGLPGKSVGTAPEPRSARGRSKRIADVTTYAARGLHRAPEGDAAAAAARRHAIATARSTGHAARSWPSARC